MRQQQLDSTHTLSMCALRDTNIPQVLQKWASSAMFCLGKYMHKSTLGHPSKATNFNGLITCLQDSTAKKFIAPFRNANYYCISIINLTRLLRNLKDIFQLWDASLCLAREDEVTLHSCPS